VSGTATLAAICPLVNIIASHCRVTGTRAAV
jgi:hypothetical protein